MFDEQYIEGDVENRDSRDWIKLENEFFKGIWILDFFIKVYRLKIG